MDEFPQNPIDNSNLMAVEMALVKSRDTKQKDVKVWKKLIGKRKV